MTLTADETIALAQPPFAKLLDIRTIEANGEDEVVAELLVREDLTNRNGMLHGGAIMTLADNVAGTATYRQMAPGQYTVTMESKTNFFRPIPLGTRVRAVARGLHIGRRTMVWEVSLYLEDGRLAAKVTQTQMVMNP
ncbi:PaaI family thioesterase [Falsigemmobacter intermedius]|uniref:PaaI family thioesterase n=1 Tax=Falsigemmobacter intermedius TaxID=1553448 RepID=UPI003F03CE38